MLSAMYNTVMKSSSASDSQPFCDQQPELARGDSRCYFYDFYRISQTR